MIKTNQKQFKIALAGQPNAGKTSIFNALTGSTGHVGNYPGVTVERRDGSYSFNDINFNVIDLPGTYSLSSFSPEERIAQTELLDSPPDVVVVVVDSTALTRSLVFFAQVMQTKAKTVLVLNMADESKAAGQRLDLQQMSSLVGCPVIQTTAHKREGIEELKSAVEKVAINASEPRLPVLGERLTNAIAAVETKLAETSFDKRHHTWVACKLLQGDKAFTSRTVREGQMGHAAIATATKQRAKIEKQTGLEIEIFIAERYHGFAHGLVTEVMLQRPRADARAVSDLVDRILAHKLLGLPIFIGIMYTIFWITFSVGDIPMGWIETGFGWLGSAIGQTWPADTAPVMRSLVLDGIIGGVGGVVVFLPNIVLLFLGLALLEDTGYMARAAFIIDQLMHRFGLHGKSFLPLLTGFGCSIPGIMATRTLENERDRLTTIFVLPLMSCGARLPIWMLLVPAFFAENWRTTALMIIYLGGALLALVIALLLRKTVFKGKEAPFVMELPPYRVPTVRALLGKMNERSWLYLRKAGTVILGISIVMWFITAFPKVDTYEVDRKIASGQIEIVSSAEHTGNSEGTIERITAEQAENQRSAENIRGSVAGKLGRLLEPVLRPLGFDWKLATGMIGAFAAKEVFVSQMGIVHALGETDEESSSLRQYLSKNYSPLVGISLILFLLIATPCMATVAVTKRESGGWKWAIYQFAGLTVVAYVISLVVFQGGSLVGWG